MMFPTKVTSLVILVMKYASPMPALTPANESTFGVNPDISQQSFHNSSIFTRRSLTKLVSFRETFQDEIAK